MRVLHIFAGLNFSGAEIMYVAAASTFQRMGCELYVIATHKEKGEYAPYFEKAGFNVQHWPYERLSILDKISYWRKMILYIRENKIDVIHIHRHNMKFAMGFCAWLAGAKSVYTFHSVFRSPKVTYPYHVLLRWGAKTIFHQVQQSISDSVYENELNYFHNTTIKVYNWYNSDRFFPAGKEEKSEVRRELGIDNDALVVISVGGCSYIKRHEDIIRAMAKVRRTIPNSIYLHLGEGATTSDEERLAESLDLGGHVRFVGNKEIVRKYLIASDIYVMTSRQEGLSLTTVEAMACGIPAVLYNVPGLRDFNNEGECSVLIDEVPDSLADALCSLYRDKDKQRMLCRNAMALVKKKYDMVTNAQKIYGLYGKC